jgi:hypothetical protein
MSKNNGRSEAHRENEQTKHTSTARCKYKFELLVEESNDGVLQPQQRISMSGDVEVTEVRKFVRAAVKGALEGVGDHFGLDDESEQDPLEDPNNPEETLNDSPEE